MTSSTDWKRFFLEAGIPAAASEQYAVNFAENRISMDMLLELNKDYLRDLGIFVLGDIIAILRRAKAVQGKMTDSGATTAATSAVQGGSGSGSGSGAAANKKNLVRIQPPSEKAAPAATVERRKPPAAPSSATPTPRPASSSSSKKSSSSVSSRLGPPAQIKFSDLPHQDDGGGGEGEGGGAHGSRVSKQVSVFSRLDTKEEQQDDEVQVRTSKRFFFWLGCLYIFIH